METDPQRWIRALRAGHDRMAALVAAFGDDELGAPSMCTEWSIAQVLSHLGSGAEIARAPLLAATGGDGADVDPQAVWARWNAMSPREMGDAFVVADRTLVETFEALDDAALAAAQVQVPFLPEPVDIAGFAGLRLGEHALHEWDVTAAFDPTSEVAPDAAELLVDRQPMMVGLMGRFLPRETRPARDVTITVVTTAPARRFELELGDAAELRPVAGDAVTDGELHLAAGAFLRLIAGRLTPGHPGADAAPTGGLTIDELRTAFPGF